jgi:hypothetical protein
VASGKFIPWNQVDGASQKAFHQDGSTQAEKEIHIQCPGCSNEVKILAVNLSIFF